MRDAVIMALVTLGGWSVVGGFAETLPPAARFGIFTSGCALVSTALLLLYWWRVQRTQGFEAKPRVSFREILVLYFGLSVEVGLIVKALQSSGYDSDHMIGLAAMFLPPGLVVAIALIDDVPATVRIKSHHRNRR
jgi:hypothetical protein